MFLIIAHPGDAAALCFYEFCANKKNINAKLINADTLSSARSWKFTITEEGRSSLSFQLYTGQWINDSDISAVFNRMQYVDAGIWKMASQKEFQYAQQELHAFFLAWLYSLAPKVMNRPTPVFFGGEHANTAVWRKNAFAAGIPVLTFTDKEQQCGELISSGNFTAKKKVYIVHNTIIGHVKGMPGTQRLSDFAEKMGSVFFEMDFYRQDKIWKLDTVNTFPTQFHSCHQCMEALYHYFLTLQNDHNGFSSRHTQRAAS